jgi:hypothetical protein
MSSLLVSRPRTWPMRDEEEDLQGSLFDELRKPEVVPPEDPVEEIRVSRAPEARAVGAPVARTVSTPDAPARDAPEARALEMPDAPVEDDVARAPLAGPTLDDAVSRAWEGLVARMPAACPVCHNDIVPAPSGPLLGECGTCGITLD